MDYNIYENEFIIPSKQKPLSHVKGLRVYHLKTMNRISHLHNLKKDVIDDMKVVAHVFPFKTNNYVINNLINWNNIPNDPIFRLNFPQKGMLLPQHYRRMRKAISAGSKETIQRVANEIRMELNPNPAGQKDYNVPSINDEELAGVQHKYRETALFFPQGGQTCHAYCTFCFRWSQFVTLDENLKFGTKQIDNFIEYLHANPTISDILITGGDPMILTTNRLERYIQPILNAKISHLRTIRIGSKSLSYWPHRFIDDRDSDQLLGLFSEIIDCGLNLSFMAHFNHYQELQSSYLKMAVHNILKTGARIMTQSPLLNNINASANVWAKMWRKQVDLGMIPYYMFIARDTGAQHYFKVPLVKAWKIFKDAYSNVSGICRTVRGPTMSCTSGKITVLGPAKVQGKKVLTLNFLQGRNPEWINKPFFAKYNAKAIWIDQLTPAFSNKFFFEKELKKFLGPYKEMKKNEQGK